MKRAFPVLVLCILVALPSTGLDITTFEGGKPESIAETESLDLSDSINLSLPAQCHILKAAMNVSALLPDYEHPMGPSGVQVFLNDTLIWQFNGTGYGGFGVQGVFADGSESWASGFDTGGGGNETVIRIPQNATIRSAVADITCTGPGIFGPFKEIVGGPGDLFGTAVANAGDLNGDGYSDIVVGAPFNDSAGDSAGMAIVFFGGTPMDTTPDVIFKGAAAYDEFGASVAGAGDVNKDGYDDLIVGAYGNDAGGSRAGRAYIFFGGKSMDSTADVTLTGAAAGDAFGCVAGAGDANGDGYADVIVGASGNDAGGSLAGRAYIFFGGSPMNNGADLAMTGAAAEDLFGGAVAGAGDVDADGYDDVVVGARQNDNNGYDAGRAYVFLGGSKMDNISDVAFNGPAWGAWFGREVSGAGDVNGDGYDDVVVGTIRSLPAGKGPGCAWLYLGGPLMDSDADVVFTGGGENDNFGDAVSGAGDVNRDGYDDLLVGEPHNDTGGSWAGRAYLYYGGAAIDRTPDAVFTGARAEDELGCSVSGAGDVDGDGYADVVVGAEHYMPSTNEMGRALVFKTFPGALDPVFSVGQTAIWSQASYFNGTARSRDFSAELDRLVRQSPAGRPDGYGNSFVDIPFCVSASSEGEIKLSGLKIAYSLGCPVADFTGPLNAYIKAHGAGKGSSEMVSAPIRVTSDTPGRLRLEDLLLRVDEAPVFGSAIPDVSLPEDSLGTDLLDIWQYVQDDRDAKENLSFRLAPGTDKSIVKIDLAGNRYLGGDALSGDQNDNWTGEVVVTVEASDSWGSVGRSNPFRVVVTNVNDAPALTSTPPTQAEAGIPWSYNVTAVDGDSDPIGFSLPRGPRGMAIDAISGGIDWMPKSRGTHEVTVEAWDGMNTTRQEFSVLVPNKPPRITSRPPPGAAVGVPWRYCITAEDDNGDALSGYLSGDITVLDNSTGTMIATITPSAPGTLLGSLQVSDGLAVAYQNFTVTVIQPNRPPEFTSPPVAEAFAGVRFSYVTEAADRDNDTLGFSSEDLLAGMTLDRASGRLDWTPPRAGNFTINISVSDGRGGSDLLKLTISVQARVKARVDFKTPAEGQKVGGKVALSGGAARGTLEIKAIHIRVDNGEWSNASGNSNWSYTLDTTKLTNGKHTLKARAYDGMEYSDVVNRTVTVDNARPAGKGLIPGFGLALTMLAICSVVALMRRARK